MVDVAAVLTSQRVKPRLLTRVGARETSFIKQVQQSGLPHESGKAAACRGALTQLLQAAEMAHPSCEAKKVHLKHFYLSKSKCNKEN